MKQQAKFILTRFMIFTSFCVFLIIFFCSGNFGNKIDSTGNIDGIQVQLSGGTIKLITGNPVVLDEAIGKQSYPKHVSLKMPELHDIYLQVTCKSVYQRSVLSEKSFYFFGFGNSEYEDLIWSENGKGMCNVRTIPAWPFSVPLISLGCCIMYRYYKAPRNNRGFPVEMI